MSLTGLVRNTFRKAAEGESFGPVYNTLGNMLVDQAQPSLATLARQGLIYHATSGPSTNVVPVATWPTTAATMFLFNNNPETGLKHFVILDVAAFSMSGTLGLGMALLAAVTLQAQTTKPTAYTGTIISGMTGKGNNSGALFANAHTITGGTPAWRVLAARDQVSAVSVGSGLVADVKGSMIVPPQYGLAMVVLAPLGTDAKFNYGVTFAMIDGAIE